MASFLLWRTRNQLNRISRIYHAFKDSPNWCGLFV
jgi:hypothetical protein